MNELQQKNSLFEFLLEELKIPSAALNLVIKKSEISYGSLPMLLWQYGLITLAQLDKIFTWQEQSAQL
uniref:DUF2949 domain-containing protein n=2 Tax=Gloeothece TaxID=28070 RepID=E0UIE7_GLOV7|nr:conserved hypothetical protein [Gloeothece verrucosa PCC 7822]